MLNISRCSRCLESSIESTALSYHAVTYQRLEYSHIFLLHVVFVPFKPLLWMRRSFSASRQDLQTSSNIACSHLHVKMRGTKGVERLSCHTHLLHLGTAMLSSSTVVRHASYLRRAFTETAFVVRYTLTIQEYKAFEGMGEDFTVEHVHLTDTTQPSALRGHHVSYAHRHPRTAIS